MKDFFWKIKNNNNTHHGQFNKETSRTSYVRFGYYVAKEISFGLLL